MAFRKTASNIRIGLPEDGSSVPVVMELSEGCAMCTLKDAAQEAGATNVEQLSDSMLSAQIPQEAWPKLEKLAAIHIKPGKQMR